MRSKKSLLSALTSLLPLIACSCNTPPARYVDAVPWAIRQHGIHDAKSQPVKGQPGLRMDAVLLDRLNVCASQMDLAEMKSQAIELFHDAHQLALSSTAVELARLDDATWAELAKRYYGARVLIGDAEKQQLADVFRRETETHIWFLCREIDQATSTQEVHRILNRVREQTEESAKTAGRTGRSVAFALFAVPSRIAQNSIHANEATCQLDQAFESAIRYVPTDGGSASPSIASSVTDAGHWQLLQRYAPIIVQEQCGDIEYPASFDLIGEVRANNDESIDIETTRPAVYCYTRKILVGARPHLQLIYAIWYPAHPKLREPVDPEEGKIDGATVRITLDSQMRPAILETLNNCGCHHRMYPVKSLDERAAGEFGSPLKGKSYAIEQDVTSKYDVIIPKLIDPALGARPIVRCRAGTHAVVDVDFVNVWDGEPQFESREYRVASYDELEMLRAPNGRTTSMFESNGLVRGAQRLEGTLFAPLGMLNAGQPRQRGTQLINWDQFDFDDPRLFEKTVRLPSDF